DAGLSACQRDLVGRSEVDVFRAELELSGPGGSAVLQDPRDHGPRPVSSQVAENDFAADVVAVERDGRPRSDHDAIDIDHQMTVAIDVNDRGGMGTIVWLLVADPFEDGDRT